MDRAVSKTCAKCGRTIEWRRKWSRNWDEVRYCSARCRTERLSEIDRALELKILDLLDVRAGKSICPSEVARALEPDAWRELMEPARQAARRLVAEGKVVIAQRGRVVDGSTARGPIRIRRS